MNSTPPERSRSGAKRPEGNEEVAISVLVPRVESTEELGLMIAAIERLRTSAGAVIEVLVVDRGSLRSAAGIDKDWVRQVALGGGNGPSLGALIRASQHPVLVVADGCRWLDVALIPRLCAELLGSELVTLDASSSDAATACHRLTSWLLRAMVQPLTKLPGAEATFFAVRRDVIERTPELSPELQSASLEVLVRCRISTVKRVTSAHAAVRRARLDGRAVIRYVRQLRSLYILRYENLATVVHFMVVGTMGLLCNLSVFTALVLVGAPPWLALALAIVISVSATFVLNRRYTFRGKGRAQLVRHLFGYWATSSLGMCTNYAATLWVLRVLPGLSPQLAILCGSGAAMMVTFVGARYIVFSRT